MNQYLFVAMLLLLLFSVSCEKEVIEPALIPPVVVPSAPAPAPPPAITYDTVGGYVQKGPFLNGTAMMISELDSALVPTGKTYTTQLIDNRGTFAVRNVELESQYVQLYATGFYFNEVTNVKSSAQLTLFALSDLSDKHGVNINVLSSLEKGRIEYLLDAGSDFAPAKRQAQREILSIFEIDAENMVASELLDISAEGEENGMLLAVSVMLQGYLGVADFSELLANLSTDLREDGVVDSRSLGSILVNNAVALQPEEIRANLTARYEAMGITVSIPAFERYVKNFLAETDFEYRNTIVYPASGAYGQNLLFAGDTLYAAGSYSLAAELPDAYQRLRAEVSGSGWLFNPLQNDTGWNFSNLGPNTSRTFTTTRTGAVDFELQLQRTYTPPAPPPPPSTWPSGPLEPCYTDQGNPFPELDTVQDLPPYPCLTGLDTIFPPPPPPTPEPPAPEPLPKIRIALYENGNTEALWIKEFTVQ